MARFGTYDDAVRLVQQSERLNQDAVRRALDVNPTVAEAYLRRLEDDGLIGAEENDGWRRVVRGHRRRWSGGGASGGSTGVDWSSPEQRLHDLQAQVEKLRAAAAESEAWRQRALAAEARLANGGATHTPQDQRVEAVRRLLARELHPDAPAHEPAEQRFREDLFKRLWPQIDRLTRGQPADVKD